MPHFPLTLIMCSFNITFRSIHKVKKAIPNRILKNRSIILKEEFQNMNTQVSEQIETLGNKLKERFNVLQIIIFGSQAYGNPDEGSDIDLCIITDLKNKRKIDIIREMRRELIDLTNNPLDILVYTEKEFNERASLKNTLEYKIMLDGIQVYG